MILPTYILVTYRFSLKYLSFLRSDFFFSLLSNIPTPMRNRKAKIVDGVTYVKVDTSKYFKVKPRRFYSALQKLHFIHSKEIRDMFSYLTVDNLLADKSEARFVMSFREAVEQSIKVTLTKVIPTHIEYTEDIGYNYPKYTPRKFAVVQEETSMVLPTVKWAL